MNIKRQVWILALALFVASPVAAQKSTDWHDWPTGGRFGMSAGVFNPNLDTTIVVTDADGIVGTGISFENNLGLDDSESTVLVDIIINANIGVEWQAFKNVGFFANYQVYDVDVDYLDKNVRFAVDYDNKGPVLGVTASF